MSVILKIWDSSGWVVFSFSIFIATWFLIYKYLLVNTSYDKNFLGDTDLATFVSLFFGMTNIFIFGIFTIKVNKDEKFDYKMIYYTIATFKRLKWINENETKVIRKNSISKYKMISIYAHISFLLLHISFLVSNIFFKDIVVFSVYLFVVTILTIRFIYVFSKTFVVKLERMKIINTLVYIRMFELFIVNDLNKKHGKAARLVKNYDKHMPKIDKWEKIIDSKQSELVQLTQTVPTSPKEHKQMQSKTKSIKFDIDTIEFQILSVKTLLGMSKIDERDVIYEESNLQTEWREYLLNLDETISIEKNVDKELITTKDKREFLGKFLHEVVMIEYLQKYFAKNKKKNSSGVIVDLPQFESELYKIYIDEEYKNDRGEANFDVKEFDENLSKLVEKLNKGVKDE